ncbi:MAG: response regulator transcription factor [Flavobacteriales bacterium]
MKYRVALFDDNADQREALELMLESSELMACVGSFPDGDRAVERVAGCTPDLVLMDIDMPHATGIECVALLRQRFPQLRILMRTVFEDDDKIFNAIRAGADGYFLKQTPLKKLLEGIVEAMEGGAPMSPAVARKVLEFSKRQPARADVKNEFSLTDREHEILSWLVKGYSYKMIAAELYISFSTVNTHVNHVYNKLHVNSATEAVALAMRKGMG